MPSDNAESQSAESAATGADKLRRATVQGIVGLGVAGYVGAIGYPVYRYLATPVREAAAQGSVSEIALAEADLPPAGEAMYVKFGSTPALLIHHPGGEVVCLSAVCTHLGCNVEYQASKSRIFCACHEGIYDPTTGEATGGPPPKGLTTYNVERRDGQLIISR